MLINNGIINIGNNNTIINNETINQELEAELTILSKHTNDENVSLCLSALKENNENKFKKAIKKLGKGTLSLIKSLSLTALEKYIESLF